MATETTSTAAEGWRPNVQGFAPEDSIPEALILQTSTVSGRVEGDEPMLLVPYVGGAEAQFVAEGAPIPEDDIELGQVPVSTGKVAHLTRLSAELMSQPNASQLIMNAARRAVILKANQAYVAQAAPVAPAVTPPAGLANITGITDGGAVAADLDAVVDAVAGIEAGGGTATHIIAAPSAWASLSKFKAATGSSQNLLGAGTADAVRTLLDVPVLVTPAMTADTLLVVDKSAVVSAVGEVRVATSEHAYFGSDSVGVRVTWRFGQNVVAPDRIVKLTVTAPA